MDIYTVFCIIPGETNPFSVDIPKDKTVDYLKKMIKVEKSHALNDIDADTLELYEVAIPDDDDLLTNVAAHKLEFSLKSTKTIVSLFKGIPPPGMIHFIVKPPDRKRKHSLSDAGDRDPKRRKTVQTVKDIQTSITPSSVKLKDIIPFLGNGMTYNRPDALCTTLPIALVHPIFANFLEDYQHLEPTKEDNRWLAELRNHMLKRYSDEADRCLQFRRIFDKHTGISIHDASIPGTSYRTDGHAAVGEHIFLISEGKNEWASLNCDPQLQTLIYFCEYAKKTADEVFKRSPLPCLIIYYVGSLIGFAGVVNAGGAQFEVLTPLFDLATNEHDRLALKPIARALAATRVALDSLNKYYTELRVPKQARSLVNPGFPSRNYYINCNAARIEFDYEERLDENKLLFRVLSKEDRQKLIVKFTQKYSKEAHIHCSSYGIAPELYAVEKLGGGWMMVVMEYLNEELYTLLRDSNTPKNTQYAMVARAVSVLHQGNFVHGDIRNVNIMVRKDWERELGEKNVKLIDFDWAGPDGTTRYPANVNYEDIPRPEGARDGQLITKEHDNAMVGFLP